MAVRFGIMGCGGISSRFCSVLNSVEGTVLQGVAARDPAKAKAFAGQYGAVKAYVSYEALARDEAIDIVYIGTIHSNHHELIRLCLENGRRVLCEKPMVLTAEVAKALTTLAEEKNLLLMEAMWTRCLPTIRKVREWVADKAIGEARLVTANFSGFAHYDSASRLFDPALAGGALYDVGVYVIEFATGVLGENPCSVSGAVHRAPSGVDDCVAISLTFPGGALASLNCGTNAWAPHTAAIYGTDGYIEIEAEFWRAKTVKRYDAKGELAEAFSIDFDDGFLYEIKHVMDLVERDATQSELIPWRDTIACAEVFDSLLGTK